MSRRWKIFGVVLVVNLVLDHLTKWWARGLPIERECVGIPQTVISNFWEWQLSCNKGSAFGLFHGIGGARVFLTVIGIAALIAVGFMVKSATEKQTRLIVGLGMVAGGAIGNILDRIIFGHVTDFVVWRYYDNVWPTFNVADVSLVVGVGLMLLDMRKSPDDEDGADDGEGEGKAAKGTGAKSRGKANKKPASKKRKRKR